MRRAILAWGIVLAVASPAGTLALPQAYAAEATAQSRGGQRVTKVRPTPGSSRGRQSGAARTAALSPVQRQLARNSNLASRLTDRLPKGFDAVSASSGFRTLGQFAAAVTASNNLEIPFVTLKSRIVDRRVSLGDAIRELRPSADHRAEVRRAERDAANLIAGARR
jgi:hypothetical protein